MSDDIRQYSSNNSNNDNFFEGTGIIANPAEQNCGCFQPGPEKIQVEQVLGAEMAQKVVEFDLIVPDPKPDIEQVIDVYVKNVEINTVDVITDKVVIRGELEVKVMYVADLPNQPVHAYERKHVRFTRDIVIAGALRGMDAEADISIEYVNYDFHRHHDRRKVHITIVVKCWARVMTTTEMDVFALGPVTDLGPAENYNTTAGSVYSSGELGIDTTNSSASQTGGGEGEIQGFGENNAFINGQNMMSEIGPGNMSVAGPGIAPTAGTSMGVSGKGTITGSGVNVRTGPGTNFPIVSKIDKGATVTIKEQAFGWYNIVFGEGNVGWVASWLIDTGTGVIPEKPKG